MDKIIKKAPKLTKDQRESNKLRVTQVFDKVNKIAEEITNLDVKARSNGFSVFNGKTRLFKVLNQGKIEINCQLSEKAENLIKAEGFHFYENPKDVGNVRYYGPLTHKFIFSQLKSILNLAK